MSERERQLLDTLKQIQAEAGNGVFFHTEKQALALILEHCRKALDGPAMQETR